MSEITRIQNSFSQTDFDNAFSALDLLSQTLSDGKGLSARQKSRLIRMGKANLGFIEAADRAMKALPDLRPAFLDPADFDRDLMLVYSTKNLLLKLEEVASMVEDTQAIMGNEAFYNSLAIYRVVQAAYRMGYPGVKPYYDDLTERWATSFRNTDAETGESAPSDEVSPEGSTSTNEGGESQAS